MPAILFESICHFWPTSSEVLIKMYLKAREIAQGLRCDWSYVHPWYPYDLLSTARDHMGCQGWIKILSPKCIKSILRGLRVLAPSQEVV